ncbi:MBL fold metallo-hydrolase [Nocardioides cynanchi]|uniref:MBL fold metallo-hydrolase n=1 Tax=Nocardioides cynanchi TaxID=2558918 RepID=UPI001245DE87|nr:MBL fold metallo-hydrolase [Nocardioides cynanchi]
MRLTVIGCSGSFAGPGSAASCYLVEADDADGRTWRILLDLGSGALGALQEYADADAVDAVFFSHLHPDHCLDLCGYYVMRKYHPGGALPPIPVWGPAGVAARMTRAYDLANEDDMSGEFDFHEYADGSAEITPVEIGPFLVEPVRVAHPVPAYAVRVTAEGRTLAYTGDTGPCDALDRLAGGADLLLAEASFHHGEANPPDVHLTGHQAGQVAARNEVPRLVITHVPPWYDVDAMVAEARLTCDGEVVAAVPGASYSIS